MKRVLLVLVAGAVALLSCASTVFAATAFERVGSFAEAFPDGQAAHHKRIAVNHASGALYVTDVVNDQIAVYTPNGTGADLLTTFGAGDLTNPFGIAIDDATGDVYVSDDDDVIKYTSDGAPTPTFTKDNTFTSPGVTGPLAFDQAAHELLVADRAANRIRRYSTVGVAGASFDGSAGAAAPGAFAGLQDLAVDSTGDIVVVDSTGDPAQGTGTSSVLRYSDAGSFEAVIGPVPGAATVAIRPSDDDVVVSGNQDAVQRNEKPTLRAFTAAGVPTVTPAADASTIYSTVSGMASAAGATGQLFVATDVDVLYGFFGRVSVQVYRASPIVAPAISGVSAEASESNVRIKAKIATSAVTTTYRIQFGTSTAYGTDLPAAGAGELAGAFTPTAIAQQAFSLSPSTTYHYRITATSFAGTTSSGDLTFTTSSGEVAQGEADRCPNAAIRAQQGAGDLPDCRAYEQVSPTNKDGSPVFDFPESFSNFGVTAATREGDAATYIALTPFGNAEHGVAQSVRSRRTAGGWQTIPVSPPPTVPNPNIFGDGIGMWTTATPDLSLGLTMSNNQWSPADGNNGVFDAQDIYSLSADGKPTLQSVAPDGSAVGNAATDYTVSRDGRHVLFTTYASLAPGDIEPFSADLYERVDGQTRPVGLLPDGSFPGPCGSSIMTSNGDALVDVSPAARVASDGSRVVFQTPSRDSPCYTEPTRIYVRIDGQRTVEVTRDHRTTPDPDGWQSAHMVAAAADATRIFFTTATMLTDDAADDANPSAPLLYEFRTDTESLTYVGLANVAADIAEVSADGERIWFLDSAARTPEATEGRLNLYLLHAGTVEWIATATASNSAGSSTATEMSYGTSTPDGRSFVFATTTDFGVGNTGGKQQAYLYRVGKPLVCVSCPATSAPAPTSDALIRNGDGVVRHAAKRTFASSISDDGSRVIFDTVTALSPADTNNRRDVYEWHDGKVSLLSSGVYNGVAYAFGLSKDGRDAFFTTSASLAPGDRDGGDLDLYDARIDGGFLAEEKRPSECEGDGCQAAPSSPPAVEQIRSDRASGSGDQPAIKPTLKLSMPNASARARAARTGTLRLAVRVTRAGRVSGAATARVKVKGRGLAVRSVAAATVSVARPGPATLTLRLSAAARQRLRGAGSLPLRITVRAPGAGRATLVLTLRRASR